MPEPGVPRTIVARNGLTMLIHPSHSFFRYTNLVGRFTEYSFSIRTVFCMNDSFSILNTSSIRSFFSIRLTHTPAISIRIYPAVSVEVYNPAMATEETGKSSIHQFMKNRTSPPRKKAYILFHVIFWFLTPFVPRQESARNTSANTFVSRRLLKSPAVRRKFSRILSTIPMEIPISENT